MRFFSEVTEDGHTEQVTIVRRETHWVIVNADDMDWVGCRFGFDGIAQIGSARLGEITDLNGDVYSE
jgi:hypothetical protein